MLNFAAEVGVDDTFCPVRLWESYARLSTGVRKPGGPAFVMASGKALSRNVMVKRTAQLMIVGCGCFVCRREGSYNGGKGLFVASGGCAFSARCKYSDAVHYGEWQVEVGSLDQLCRRAWP